MTLPLILGEIPSYAERRYHHFPLSGAVGKRLCEFAGILPEDEGSKYGKWYWALREHFDCANAIERYQEKWDQGAANQRVRELLRDPDGPPPAVIALGRRAGLALSIPPAVPWGSWWEYASTDLPMFSVTRIPHPSGRNLLYNDSAMRDLAGRVLREAIEQAVAA